MEEEAVEEEAPEEELVGADKRGVLIALTPLGALNLLNSLILPDAAKEQVLLHLGVRLVVSPNSCTSFLLRLSTVEAIVLLESSCNFKPRGQNYKGNSRNQRFSRELSEGNSLICKRRSAYVKIE